MRRFGSPPDPDTYYAPRAGAYGVILHDGQVLLTEQSHPSIGVEIQLPGGGIDPGESPVAALHREVMEETGWRVQVLHKLTSYRRFTYMPDYDQHREKIVHIYLCRAVFPLGPPSEPFHRAMLCAPCDALNRLGPVGDRHALARFLSSGPASRPSRGAGWQG